MILFRNPLELPRFLGVPGPLVPRESVRASGSPDPLPGRSPLFPARPVPGDFLLFRQFQNVEKCDRVVPAVEKRSHRVLEIH